MEEQAIDRVHRLNQTRDVIVYKMTIKDTVEARIVDLQDRKRELANATIEGNKNAAAKLTLKDMLDLFRHDAESKAKIDGVGMKDGGAGLMASRQGDRGVGNGGVREREKTEWEIKEDERLKRERERRKNGSGGAKRTEDSVYGRRW